MRKFEDVEEVLYTAYIYHKDNFRKPILELPLLTEPYTCIRFCPLIFKDNKKESILNNNYKMVFAAATLHSVYIYATNELRALVAITQLHLSDITDLAWSPDAKYLAIASRDGFCSMVTFEGGELGEISQNEDLDENEKNWFYFLNEVKMGTFGENDKLTKSKQDRISKKRINVEIVDNGGKKAKIDKKRIVPLEILGESVNKKAKVEIRDVKELEKELEIDTSGQSVFSSLRNLK